MQIRVATYNIHKGVQGLGIRKRLEIHRLRPAIASLEADIICLQEVRKSCRLSAARFVDWPHTSQAEYLAPEGYDVVYYTNAYTRHGEHGNAVLSRWPALSHQHQDISDHRFEQRGLLHAVLDTPSGFLHVIAVHLGLISGSRLRQVDRLTQYIAEKIPQDAAVIVAGDFNEWGDGLTQRLAEKGLSALKASSEYRTFPSRLPLAQLDHIYMRGLEFVDAQVIRGAQWAQMSDHLPLIATLRKLA